MNDLVALDPQQFPRLRRSGAPMCELWLRDGRLLPEQFSRLLTVLTQLRDLYRHHVATEDNEVFTAAAAALSASDRAAIGSEMASRRGIPVSA